MEYLKTILKATFFVVLMVFFISCEKEELNQEQVEFNASAKAKPIVVEGAGNNLSFPAIWAEGVEKALRDEPAAATNGLLLDGSWWYVWGAEPIDPASLIYSCEPSPIDEFLCIDQTEPGEDVYKAWLQNDPDNYWKAYTEAASGIVEVDALDWGDNLESLAWSIKAKVRTELGLYKTMDPPVLQYPMRHVSGWGTSEIHGLQTDLNGNIMFDNAPGDQASIYSTLTRMTIQKLNVERTDTEALAQLVWDSETHQWIDNVEDDILVINEPILSQAISEAGTGPEFFNAEVNIKGKIIYGYTWDLKKLNEGTGDYRITYSFDKNTSTPLNTFITEATTIVQAAEEVVDEEGEIIIASEGDTGGTGVLDATNNLTYMDIMITGNTTGGGGGNSGGGNGGGKKGGN